MHEPLLSETVYHIYNHANGNENLFRTDENYHYFLRKYGEYMYPMFDTYAYCLMPNHFHLMVRVRSEADVLEYLRLTKPTLTGFKTLSEFSETISKQFGHLCNGYTQSYNKMYGRMGSLFIRPFKRKSVTDEVYFTQLIAYIHNNPVHHGICKDLLDWSSGLGTKKVYWSFIGN
jgi:putative transposase